MNITTSVSAITSQGESVAVWMQSGSTGDAGKAEVYVYGTDQGIPSSSTIIESGRRIYEPINNTDRAVLSAQNEYWIFYACCKNTGDTAEIVVSYDINYRKEIDVSIQDQTTDPIIMRFNKITNSTTLASAVTLFDRTITVDNPAGIAVGSYLIIFNNTVGKVMPCVVTSIASSPTIAIDRPADYAFPAGSNVDVTFVGMNIDSSSSELVMGIRGPDSTTAVDVSLDINEIRLFCITSTIPTLEEFADLGLTLTNGLVLRSRNGGYKNISVMKSNAEILGAFGNWTPYIGTNPGIGVNGFVARLHFNGQDNLGVAKRIGPGEDLELVAKSALQSIVLLEAVAVGHVVEP